MNSPPPRRLGFILLGVWLIGAAVIQILPGLAPIGLIMPFLQLVAGILIIIGR